MPTARCALQDRDGVPNFVRHAARAPLSVVREFLIDGGWRPL